MINLLILSEKLKMLKTYDIFIPFVSSFKEKSKIYALWDALVNSGPIAPKSGPFATFLTYGSSKNLLHLRYSYDEKL